MILYNKEEMIFLTQVEHLGDSKYDVRVFMNDEDNLVAPYNMSYLANRVDKNVSIGLFYDGDLPEGENRGFATNLQGLFPHFEDELHAMVEFGKDKVYLGTKAPKKGYYIDMDVRVHYKDGKTLDDEFGLEVEDNTRAEDVITLSGKVKRAQVLDEPKNRDANQEEIDELTFKVLDDKWLEQLRELVSIYTVLVQFAHNKEVLDSAFGVK